MRSLVLFVLVLMPSPVLVWWQIMYVHTDTFVCLLLRIHA